MATYIIERTKDGITSKYTYSARDIYTVRRKIVEYFRETGFYRSKVAVYVPMPPNPYHPKKDYTEYELLGVAKESSQGVKWYPADHRSKPAVINPNGTVGVDYLSRRL